MLSSVFFDADSGTWHGSKLPQHRSRPGPTREVGYMWIEIWSFKRRLLKAQLELLARATGVRTFHASQLYGEAGNGKEFVLLMQLIAPTFG